MAPLARGAMLLLAFAGTGILMFIFLVANRRIRMGEYVMVNGKRGKITSDDGTLPYKVTFDEEVSGWLCPQHVTRASAPTGRIGVGEYVMVKGRRGRIKSDDGTPGLKLEGSKLTGEAAKYIGAYCCDGIVNGRPKYQHTSDATRWIAFSKISWLGQPVSLLGKHEGHVELVDPAAALPYLSAKKWKAWNGSAWVEQPKFKCTVWTHPPPYKVTFDNGEVSGWLHPQDVTRAVRIGMGEYVMVNGRRGRITTDEGTAMPYKVTFDEEVRSLYPHEVTRTAAGIHMLQAM